MSMEVVWWVWSDDPATWAAQLTAVFTAAAALFTGAYVWLTYRLMKATARTAEIAYLETQRERLARLIPIKKTLETLREAVAAVSASTRAGVDVARLAGALGHA